MVCVNFEWAAAAPSTRVLRHQDGRREAGSATQGRERAEARRADGLVRGRDAHRAPLTSTHDWMWMRRRLGVLDWMWMWIGCVRRQLCGCLLGLDAGWLGELVCPARASGWIELDWSADSQRAEFVIAALRPNARAARVGAWHRHAKLGPTHGDAASSRFTAHARRCSRAATASPSPPPPTRPRRPAARRQPLAKASHAALQGGHRAGAYRLIGVAADGASQEELQGNHRAMVLPPAIRVMERQLATSTRRSASPRSRAWTATSSSTTTHVLENGPTISPAVRRRATRGSRPVFGRHARDARRPRTKARARARTDNPKRH